MASAVMNNTTNTHSSHGAPRRHETPSIDSYPSKYNASYPMHASSTVNYSAASHARPSNVSKLRTSFEQSFILPDIDDEDSMYPPCKSAHAQDLPGRPQPRVPPPRLALASATPGAYKKSKRSPSSDRTSPPSNSDDRAAMALRRAENRPETAVAFRGGWEMRQQQRKEPAKRTSSARQRSPQSAKSDEGWGSSMYDVEVDGRR